MNAQEKFDQMTKEERGKHVAIAYDADTVRLHFGSLPDAGFDLADEQIKQLSQKWQERFAKAKKESDIKDCTLLAGEETEPVAHGSLYWCKEHIGELPFKDLPRDTLTGKGCWVIVKADEELATGYFDKEIAW